MDDVGQLTTAQLETFLRIAQSGSFSDTALTLGVAQPTISGRVRTLEHTIGGRLFTRRGRRVALTPRGEAFRGHAEQALAALAEGVRAARLGDTGHTGRLAIGLSDSSLADSFLGTAVARFHREHPGVEITMESSSCESLVRALHERTLRFAILPWPYAAPSFDPLRPLLRFREHLQVVTAAGHPLASTPNPTLGEVVRRAAPFLQVWWNQPSRRALDALAVLPSPALEVPVQIARHSLLQGYGAALFAPSVIAPDIATGTVVALAVADLPPIACESALVVHQDDDALQPAARAFIGVVRSAAGNLCVAVASQP